MRLLIISLALVLLGSPIAAAEPPGRVPEAWLGTWVLNVGRSIYPSAQPYNRASFRIERTGDGFRVIYDMVHPRGGTTHMEWTGRMDGRDYPLQGVDQALTYAYTSAADGSGEIVVKIDGREAARSRVTVEDGGRTMVTRTTAAGGVTSATVYEKRP